MVLSTEHETVRSLPHSASDKRGPMLRPPSNSSNDRRNHRFRIVLACLWIIAASLGPDIPLSQGLFKWRPDDVLAAAMGGFAVISLLAGRIRWVTMGVSLRVVLFVLGLGLVGSLALSLHSLSGTSSSIEGTFGYSRQQEVLKELIRWGKYVLVAFAFSQVPYRAWRPVLGTLVACCVVMIGVQVGQYISAATINPWLVDFYAGSDPHGSITYSEAWAKDTGDFRTGSVMINANVFGAFLIAPLFLFLMLLLESISATSRDIRRFRWLWQGMSGIVWIGVFLTQSRTALIAGLAGGIVSFACIPRRLQRKVVRVLTWAVVAAVISFAAFARSTNRYSLEGLVGGARGSLIQKADLTLAEVKDLGPLILVGAGPAGAGMVDNEFGYVITWYGLIGVSIYLLFYHSLFRLIVRRIQSIYLRAAFKGILAAYLVGSIGSSFVLNNRVFPMFLALLTLACAESVRRVRPPTSAPPQYGHTSRVVCAVPREQ